RFHDVMLHQCLLSHAGLGAQIAAEERSRRLVKQIAALPAVRQVRRGLPHQLVTPGVQVGELPSLSGAVNWNANHSFSNHHMAVYSDRLVAGSSPCSVPGWSSCLPTPTPEASSLQRRAARSGATGF